MEPISISIMINVASGILIFICTTAMGYAISLIKNLLNTNVELRMDLHSIMKDVKTMKEDIDSLKTSKEESKDEINSLKLLYFELKIKLDNLATKHV